MLQWFSKISNYRIKKSYFLKMLIFYTVFTIIVLIVSFALTVNVYDRSLLKEINVSNKRLLTQVQINTDKNMFEKVSGIINQYFLDSSTTSMAHDFFNFNPYKELKITLNIFKYLSDTRLKYEYIDSICLYKKQGNVIIDTVYGINMDIFSDNQKNTPILYINMIKNLINSKDKIYWISPKENAGNFPGSPTITYVQSIPIYTPFNQSDGCIIFNMNYNLLFKQLNEIYGDYKNGEIVLLDPDGRQFANSNSNKLFIKMDLNKDLDRILGTDDGFITSSVNGKLYGITWIKSALNGWKYVSLVPVESLNRQSTALKQLILVILGIILLFSVFTLSIITSRLYNPLSQLVKTAIDKFHLVHSDGNEVHYIGDVLTFLDTKFENMTETIEENKEITKYKTMIDILYGNSSSYDIEKRLEFVNNSKNLNYYTLLIADIDYKIFSKLTYEQKEFITVKATHLINSFFSTEYTCITICHPTNNIVSLINHKGENILINALKDLLSRLNKELGISFNLALSKDYPDITTLNTTYSELKNYLKYQFIYNYNNIFTPVVIERYESDKTVPDLNLITQLENYLKALKVDKFKILFYDLAKDIKINGYSYNFAQELLLQTISMIARLCRNQGLSSESLKGYSTVTDFNKLSSLDESIEWINSIVNMYYENILLRNNSIDTSFMDKVSRFISDNISEPLSLNIVADEFNLSPNYLSRIFKENFNISFSDYISDKKLEKAAEIIINNDEKNIYEIAKQLGYFTPAYFSKIFKEKYGMTPALFRKKHLTDKVD